MASTTPGSQDESRLHGSVSLTVPPDVSDEGQGLQVLLAAHDYSTMGDLLGQAERLWWTAYLCQVSASAIGASRRGRADR